MFSECHITYRTTTAYRRHTIGLIERLNRTLVVMSAIYVAYDYGNMNRVLSSPSRGPQQHKPLQDFHLSSFYMDEIIRIPSTQACRTVLRRPSEHLHLKSFEKPMNAVSSHAHLRHKNNATERPPHWHASKDRLPPSITYVVVCASSNAANFFEASAQVRRSLTPLGANVPHELSPLTNVIT